MLSGEGGGGRKRGCSCLGWPASGSGMPVPCVVVGLVPPPTPLPPLYLARSQPREMLAIFNWGTALCLQGGGALFTENALASVAGVGGKGGKDHNALKQSWSR